MVAIISSNPPRSLHCFIFTTHLEGSSRRGSRLSSPKRMAFTTHMFKQNSPLDLCYVHPKCFIHSDHIFRCRRNEYLIRYWKVGTYTQMKQDSFFAPLDICGYPNSGLSFRVAMNKATLNSSIHKGHSVLLISW